ncbi:hypothetical protein CHUAL_004803 [Chamberlinius hualienensis]
MASLDDWEFGGQLVDNGEWIGVSNGGQSGACANVVPLSQSERKQEKTTFSYFKEKLTKRKEPSPVRTIETSTQKSLEMVQEEAKANTKTQEMPKAEADIDDIDRVKTKLLSVWNNVKYGWTVRLKTNFKRDSPIWFLGQCYHRKVEDASQGKEILAAAMGSTIATGSNPPVGMANGMEGFQQDFISRIWFTYRREFPTLAGSTYTTDCGWGCMLRSGQMLLAQGLICHLLGRAWRWHTESIKEENIHRKIVQWFADCPSERSHFSLHRLVSIGENCGKKAGDWYGPASVAHILKQAMYEAAGKEPLLKNLCIYVSQDCTVYKDDLLRHCKEVEDGSGNAGVIILVPVRLGGEILNPVYFKCVRSILSYEYCIGIIGGKPRHSLYFVGWQDDKLIHLDPHYCQEVVDSKSHTFPLQSFHCPSPRKLAFSRMDPSCTMGFYCKNKAELAKFLDSCNEVLTPQHSSDYPVFVIAETSKGNFDFQQHLTLEECDAPFVMADADIEEQNGAASYNEDFGEFIFL